MPVGAERTAAWARLAHDTGINQTPWWVVDNRRVTNLVSERLGNFIYGPAKQYYFGAYFIKQPSVTWGRRPSSDGRRPPVSHHPMIRYTIRRLPVRPPRPPRPSPSRCSCCRARAARAGRTSTSHARTRAPSAPQIRREHAAVLNSTSRTTSSTAAPSAAGARPERGGKATVLPGFDRGGLRSLRRALRQLVPPHRVGRPR